MIARPFGLELLSDWDKVAEGFREHRGAMSDFKGAGNIAERCLTLRVRGTSRSDV
jgi:hypothetical protein